MVNQIKLGNSVNENEFRISISCCDFGKGESESVNYKVDLKTGQIIII